MMRNRRCVLQSLALVMALVALALGVCAGAVASDSAPQGGTLPNAVPGLPTNVHASQGTYVDKIRVTWDWTVSATYFKVGYSTNQESWYWASESVATNSYDHLSVLPDPLYFYRVFACNNDGCGSPNEMPAAGYLGVTKPTNIVASDGVYSTHIRVAWDAATNAIGYHLYRSPSIEYVDTEFSLGNVLYYEDSSVEPGTLYYYWVKGCSNNVCGESTLADGGYRKLGAPTQMNASDGTYCDRISVQWYPVEGATSFKLYRGTSLAYDATIPVDVNLYWDYPPLASTYYYYWAQACADTGCGPLSSPEEQAYHGKPPAPTGVSATDGAYASKVHVQWSQVPGAVTYTVFRGLTPSGSASIVSGLHATSYDDTSVQCDTTYYYSVWACNDCGCGQSSDSEAGSVVTCPTSTSQATATRTNTPRPTDTAGPTNTLRPTSTDDPLRTRTPEPTATNTPRPTDTDVPTNTPKPTSTDDPQRTRTPEPTATNTPRPTYTPRPTSTDDPLRTRTPEPTATYTPRPTITRRPTIVFTAVSWVRLPMVMR
jgi:fibronectin type 3 domain-containing protein